MIPIDSGAALTNEAPGRHTRLVNSVGGKVEEERFGLVLLDKLDGFVSKPIHEFFISPASGLSARHPAEAANPVGDGAGMVIVPQEDISLLGIFASGRLVADLRFIADFDRVGRVEVFHPMIADENRGHAVAGGWHVEDGAKSDFHRPGLDLAIPIDGTTVTKSEMPFADEASGVAVAAEHLRHRERARRDAQRRVAG